MKPWISAGAALACLLAGCQVVEPTPEDLGHEVARQQQVPFNQVQVENIQNSKKFVYFDATTPTGRYSCTMPVGMGAFGTPPERRLVCDPLVQ